MATFFVKRGFLYIDFRYKGVRCQEATRRRDTPAERAIVRRLVRVLDSELVSGTFAYRKWFPNSPRVAMFACPIGPHHSSATSSAPTSAAMMFRRYSKFIPNLTRQDGSAAARWLSEHGLSDRGDGDHLVT